MLKRFVLFSLAAVLLVTTLAVANDHHEGSWTGEVVDLACYVSSGAKGADHAGCAKSCVKGGQPMGLLTLDRRTGAAQCGSQERPTLRGGQGWAGEMADVVGTLAEKDGMKMVTVTGAKAAG